jgi:hypothetical protein
MKTVSVGNEKLDEDSKSGNEIKLANSRIFEHQMPNRMQFQAAMRILLLCILVSLGFNQKLVLKVDKNGKHHRNLLELVKLQQVELRMIHLCTTFFQFLPQLEMMRRR